MRRFFVVKYVTGAGWKPAFTAAACITLQCLLLHFGPQLFNGTLVTKLANTRRFGNALAQTPRRKSMVGRANSTLG